MCKFRNVFVHQIIKADYMAEKQKESLFKSKGERESIRKVIPLMAISKVKKYKWVVNERIGIDKKRMYIKRD